MYKYKTLEYLIPIVSFFKADSYVLLTRAPCFLKTYD